MARSPRFPAIALLTVALSAAMSGPVALAAQTATAETTVTVRPGPLSLSGITVSDFDAVTIDGTATLTPATLSDFAVADFRGSGAGWHLTAQATQFAEYDAETGYVPGGATLAQGSLWMDAPEVSPVGDTSSPAPVVPPGPHAIDIDGVVTFATAAADTGMGEYAFTAASLNLSLPADVRATTYRSTVTVDLVSGP